jgi:hypothetical protein
MRSKADRSRPLPTTLDWTTSPLVRFVIIMLRQSPSRWVLLRHDESLGSARRLWDYSSALNASLFRLWRGVLSERDLLRLLWPRRAGLIERRQSIQGFA